MFTSYYSIAVDLLRRYLDDKGTVVLESFSDSQALFSLNGKPVLLSLNDSSNVTVKLGKDPDSHSVIVDMSQFDLKFPVEVLPELVPTEFGKQLDEKFQHILGYEEYVAASKNRRGSDRSLVVGPEGAPKHPFDSSLGNVSAGSGRVQRPPDMPDFEDEYEMRGKYMPPAHPMHNPSIGDADLNPAGLGRYSTMQPFLDPLRANPHGGMYPDANHPLFGGDNGRGMRPGVPPGARYDEPFSEGNMEDMGMGLPGNLRQGFGGPGGPGGPFGSGSSSFGGPGGPFL